MTCCRGATMSFARNHARRAGGIPATIASTLEITTANEDARSPRVTRGLAVYSQVSRTDIYQSASRTFMKAQQGTPPSLDELRHFIEFLRNVWAALAGVSVLFPLSNAFSQTIPVAK